MHDLHELNDINSFIPGRKKGDLKNQLFIFDGAEIKIEKSDGGPSSSRVLRKRTREVKRSELSSLVPRDEKRKRVAAGAKKFKCPQENCNKSYANNSSLRRHQGDSHGPKLVCNYCKGKFIKSNLPVHKRSCKKVPDLAGVDDEESDSGEEEDEMMGRQLLEMIN